MNVEKTIDWIEIVFLTFLRICVNTIYFVLVSCRGWIVLPILFVLLSCDFWINLMEFRENLEPLINYINQRASRVSTLAR